MAVLEKERTLADARARATLAADALERWDACQSTHQFMAFPAKQLVVCHHLFDRFNKLNTWRCEDFSFSKSAGISSQWEDENGKRMTLAYTPTEFAPNCFIWHAAYGRLESYPYGTKTSLSHRFGMLTRTLKNPRLAVPGIVYVYEKQTFDELTIKG